MRTAVQSSTSGRALTFKPRPSTGWLWPAVLGLFLILMSAFTVSTVWADGYRSLFGVLPGLLPAAIGLPFLFVALCYPTMRYEVAGSRLDLVYGPFRYRLDLRQVHKVRQCDLSYSPVNTLKFPGLAVYKVHYPQISWTEMCATSIYHRITLIETPRANYGVTPADEAGFLAALRQGIEA